MMLRNPTRQVGTGMRFKPGIRVKKMSKEEADKQFGVSSWPTWGCGVSKFDWEYSGTETAYILVGEVTVTPTGDWADVDEAKIEAGDLVTFPNGMTCIWDVKNPSTSITISPEAQKLRRLVCKMELCNHVCHTVKAVHSWSTWVCLKIGFVDTIESTD